MEKAIPHSRAILAATILGSSMMFIDGTAVNVILPQLQVLYGADALQIQWVVQAYACLLSALLLLGGALGDRFGRRRLFVIGTIAFVAASLGCAAAGSLEMLVVARALQGRGRRIADAGKPGDPHLRLSAGCARPRRGDVVGSDGNDHGGGPGGRRMACDELELAGDFFHQPARGRARGMARRALRA